MFTPAISEQQFVLENIVRLSEISADAAELLDAVLVTAGEFAVGEWAAKPCCRCSPKWVVK